MSCLQTLVKDLNSLLKKRMGENLRQLVNELSDYIPEVCAQLASRPSIRREVEGQKLEMEKVQKDLVEVKQEVGNAISRAEVDQVLQKEVTGRINKFSDKIDDSVKEIRVELSLIHI